MLPLISPEITQSLLPAIRLYTYISIYDVKTPSTYTLKITLEPHMSYPDDFLETHGPNSRKKPSKIASSNSSTLEKSGKPHQHDYEDGAGKALDGRVQGNVP